MRPIFINARDLPEAWFQCMYQLLDDDASRPPLYSRRYTIDRGSYKGQQRMEFKFVIIHIEFPGSKPMVPDVPVGIPAPVTQEYIDGYLPYLMESDKKPGEDYTYGEDVKDQIPEVIKMYKEDGHNTNQAYIAVGGKHSIFLRDPQCLRGIDTRILDGKLHFMVYFRSWDLWGGFPANLGAIQIMKEYMADEIGVADGEIIAMSKGLHLYDHSWDVAKQVLRR